MYDSSTVYHVYNQSNNFEPIFRNDGNYLHFLRKLRIHILSCADILCYCLMPDHFHLLLRPNELGCSPSNVRRTLQRDEDDKTVAYQQQLSHQIKILLSSYTRGYNRQHNRRGSLFRSGTKAKPASVDLISPELLLSKPNWWSFSSYLYNCFTYIHQNPVAAGLVDRAVEWPYSSAVDYAGLREGILCNYELAEKLMGVRRGED